jgi:basic membrane lipoprotein Med (substrate-binding protein (PBP1-ABC) superfamily)
MRWPLALVAALALMGCPSHATPPPGFKVALLTPGSTEDMGWNALAWEGAKRIEKELGCKVDYEQVGEKPKFDDELKAFALGGANVIFAHGFEYQDACVRVGEKFPNTTFIVSSGARSFANGAPLNIKLEEGLYLAGTLAAHLTKSKTLGCVGGMQLPSVKSGFEAFERAARKVDPSISVRMAYLDTWDDIAKGHEQGLALVGAGCDVIVHNADAAGRGVFNACKEKAALAIGSNRNQNEVEPGVVVASATCDFTRAMVDLAREVKEGRFKPREVVLDMKTGYVDLELSTHITLPEDVKKEIDQTRRAIVTGALDPNR